MRVRCLVLLVLVACEPAAPPPVPTKDIVEQANAEFELVPSELGFGGTSKLYSRGDFLPLDDAKAMSEGDFIGRFRTLFGPVDGDEYVLRHRATGFIVTAYSAQSGPSYGGGPRYSGPLPARDAWSATQMFEDAEARAARIQADPVLAKGTPVDWSAYDLDNLPRHELYALREKERVWHKRFADVAAPPGFAKVVTRLDGLVSSVAPADWEVMRYWGEDPTVSRVGARDGVAIDSAVPIMEGMEYLLVQAEQQQPPIKDTASGILDADERVVSYFVYHAETEPRIERVLPRVQAAWFRYVEHAKRDDEEMRDLVFEIARGQIEPLRLDRGKAEAALR